MLSTLSRRITLHRLVGLCLCATLCRLLHRLGALHRLLYWLLGRLCRRLSVLVLLASSKSATNAADRLADSLAYSADRLTQALANAADRLAKSLAETTHGIAYPTRQSAYRAAARALLNRLLRRCLLCRLLDWLLRRSLLCRLHLLLHRLLHRLLLYRLLYWLLLYRLLLYWLGVLLIVCWLYWLSGLCLLIGRNILSALLTRLETLIVHKFLLGTSPVVAFGLAHQCLPATCLLPGQYHSFG